MSAVIPFILERTAASTAATATIIQDHIDQLKQHCELLQQNNKLLEQNNELLQKLASSGGVNR